METTYRVEAKCNDKYGIDVAFKGFGNKDSAMECALTLAMAFPQVDVICEQTGEVMWNEYTTLEWFKPQVEQGKAIMRADFDRYF